VVTYTWGRGRFIESGTPPDPSSPEFWGFPLLMVTAIRQRTIKFGADHSDGKRSVGNSVF